MRGLSGTQGIMVAIRDAVVVVVASAILALGTNAVRADGIPLVAREPYRIFVPCPEPSGEIFEIEPGHVRWGEGRGSVPRGRLIRDSSSSRAVAEGVIAPPGAYDRISGLRLARNVE